MLDLTRLRILRELARRGTMTAVGEALGMTSSAVSQQLAVLARDVRAPITERTGRRVRLTPEGERLAAHAETILQAVEAAALELSAIGDTLAGALRVATFTTYGRAKLLPAVVRLRDRYPGLDIVIQELEPMESLEAVRDGRCDLAVSFEYNLVPRPVLPGLLVQPLMEEPILVALPERWRTAADPIDLQQLDGQDWIVGSQQADDRQLVERVCAVAGFAPRVTHAVANYDFVLEMVRSGLGVALVPRLAIQSPASSIVTRTLAGPAATRRIQLVTRASQPGSPRFEALLSELAPACFPLGSAI